MILTCSKAQETVGAGTSSQYHAIPDTDQGRHCVCMCQHNVEVAT